MSNKPGKKLFPYIVITDDGTEIFNYFTAMPLAKLNDCMTKVPRMYKDDVVEYDTDNPQADYAKKLESIMRPILREYTAENNTTPKEDLLDIVFEDNWTIQEFLNGWFDQESGKLKGEGYIRFCHGARGGVRKL